MKLTATALLIHPCVIREAAFPLVLGSIIPYLKQAGFLTFGFDTEFDNFLDLERRIANNEFDVAIFSALSFQLEAISSRIKRIKALSSNMPIILVGIEPSLFPAKSLEVTGADLAILGDAENIIIKAIDFLRNGGVQPSATALIKNGKTLIKGKVHWEKNLDDLLICDRETFDLSKYGYGYRSVKYPLAAISASRGCNNNCPHCQIPQLKRPYVAKKAEYIVSEMQLLVNQYGIKDIHFEDDCFFASNKLVQELCNELIKINFKAVWELVNGVRPEHIDTDIFPLMFKAGCRRIALGIEFVSENKINILGNIVQPPDRIKKITKAAKAAGISTTGYFMLGLPNISKHDDKSMIRLSRKLGLDMVHYSKFKLLENSGFAIQNQSSLRDDREIEKLLHNAYRQFYLRPSQIGWLSKELSKEPKLVPAMIRKVFTDLLGL